MAKNILIGTFGGGPGIITSILDCFWEMHRLSFDKVILVTTNSEITRKGKEDFQKHLQHSGCPVCAAHGYAKREIDLDLVAGVENVVTEADINALLSRLIERIRQESQPNTNIYLCLSGGRRPLLAVQVFAGMLFRVEGLYDITLSNTTLAREVREKCDKWPGLPNAEKQSIWEKEQALWGLEIGSTDQLPPTLGWHYAIENFSVVRLPFIGVTRFFEAFVSLVRQSEVQRQSVSQGGDGQSHRVEGWINEMKKEPNFAESFDSLSKLLQNSIDQVRTPVLLELEKNDERFWHDCIKNGTNKQDCTRRRLEKEWTFQKAFFTTHRVADPLFEEFDALFSNTTRAVGQLKAKFKALYHQLNRKIFAELHARSQPIEDWIDSLAEMVKEETTSFQGFEFFFGNGVVQNPSICTGPQLDRAVKEVLRNALAHAESEASIEVTQQAILIRNDGTFDAAKWRESAKSEDIPRICEQHHLTFNIDSDPTGNGVLTTISWKQFPRPALPVNVETIVEGGNYANAKRTDC